MAVAVQTVSTVGRGAASTNLTITKPTSLAVGDLMLAYMVSYDNDGTTRTWTQLSGWTRFLNKPDIINTGSISQSVACQWKVADSSDVAASNFTFAIGSTSDLLAGAIYRISGHHPTSPIGASDASSVFDDATPTFTTAITPAKADSLLLLLASHIAGGSSSKTTSAYAITTSNPSWTENFDDHSSTTLTIAGASASRPETTSTGNYGFTSDGDGTTDCIGTIIAVSPPTDVTVSPATVTSTSSVKAPTISGGALVSPATVTATSSVKTPSHLGQADWSAQDKSSTPTWTNTNKS